jgi:hypothetical protein
MPVDCKVMVNIEILVVYRATVYDYDDRGGTVA